MQPTQATAVTWKDFLALPDDDRRELIEGRLMELDVPTQLGLYNASVKLENGSSTSFKAAVMPDKTTVLTLDPANLHWSSRSQ